MIYAATKALMPDCPTCNGSYWESETPIIFFGSIEEFKESLKKDLNKYEYGDLYSSDGKLVFTVTYNAKHHNYTNILLQKDDKIIFSLDQTPDSAWPRYKWEWIESKV